MLHGDSVPESFRTFYVGRQRESAPHSAPVRPPFWTLPQTSGSTVPAPGGVDPTDLLQSGVFPARSAPQRLLRVLLPILSRGYDPSGAMRPRSTACGVGCARSRASQTVRRSPGRGHSQHTSQDGSPQFSTPSLPSPRWSGRGDIVTLPSLQTAASVGVWISTRPSQEARCYGEDRDLPPHVQLRIISSRNRLSAKSLGQLAMEALV